MRRSVLVTSVATAVLSLVGLGQTLAASAAAPSSIDIDRDVEITFADPTTDRHTYTDRPTRCAGAADDVCQELEAHYAPGPRFTAEPRPTVLFVPGGAWEVASMGRWLDQARVWARQTADRPDAWLTVTMRFDTKRGGRFHTQTRDVAAAVEWLRTSGVELYNVDPDRIVLVGDSAGGHLALLEGLTAERPVAGVAAWSAPTDLTALARSTDCAAVACDHRVVGVSHETLAGGAVQQFLGGCTLEPATDGSPHCTDDRYAKFSPVSHADRLGGPDAPAVLLAHGTGDDLVPFDQAEAFIAAAGADRIDVLAAGMCHGHEAADPISDCGRQVVDFSIAGAAPVSDTIAAHTFAWVDSIV